MLTENTDAGKSRVRGLGRAFEILDYLRQRKEPLRPNEIATGIKGPRTSVYEMVNLLLAEGIIERTSESGQVFLGRKLYFLGNAYAEQLDLGHEAEKMLDKLALETSQLCMLDGNKYTVAQMVEGARPVPIRSTARQARCRRGVLCLNRCSSELRRGHICATLKSPSIKFTS